MAGGRSNRSEPEEKTRGMEPVSSPGVRKGVPKMASANRIFAIKGPKVPVMAGDKGIGPRNRILVENGK